MKSRSLYRLKEDVTNPGADRRSSNDINRLPVIRKGTWFVSLDGQESLGKWWVRGYAYSPPRRRIIDLVLPHLEKVEPTTMDHVALLFDLRGGELKRFVAHLVEQGRVTMVELIEFLNTESGD